MMRGYANPEMQTYVFMPSVLASHPIVAETAIVDGM
jgi:hypothetical protein